MENKELDSLSNKGFPDKKGKGLFIIVVIAFLVLVWYMLDLVLMTFILSFVFYYVVEKLSKAMKNRFGFNPNKLVLQIIAYLMFIAVIFLLVIEALPVLITQSTGLAKILMAFDFQSAIASINPRLTAILPYVDFKTYINYASSYLAQLAFYLTGFAVDFFASMILSFVILAERKKVAIFGERVAKSKIGPVYEDLILYGSVFVKTFAKVMKVQVTIALLNCVLSMILLKIFGFPGILGLGVMIFVLGLIPVAGMVISFIPLSVVAFTIGGVKAIIEIITMILVLHAIEAYILNPRLMASKTKLPVCFVFIILLVAQHHLGVWGLLIGVPVFIFLMIALDVDYQVADDGKEKNKSENNVEN